MSAIINYESPVIAAAALVEEHKVNRTANTVALVFDRMPPRWQWWWHRQRIGKLIETNFPVEFGRWPIELRFDRLVMGRGRVCYGICVTLD